MSSNLITPKVSLPYNVEVGVPPYAVIAKKGIKQTNMRIWGASNSSNLCIECLYKLPPAAYMLQMYAVIGNVSELRENDGSVYIHHDCMYINPPYISQLYHRVRYIKRIISSFGSYSNGGELYDTMTYGYDFGSGMTNWDIRKLTLSKQHPLNSKSHDTPYVIAPANAYSVTGAWWVVSYMVGDGGYMDCTIDVSVTKVDVDFLNSIAKDANDTLLGRSDYNALLNKARIMDVYNNSTNRLERVPIYYNFTWLGPYSPGTYRCIHIPRVQDIDTNCRLDLYKT